MMRNKLKKYLKNKQYRFILKDRLGLYKILSDEKYIKKRFKTFMGYDIDLKNPCTFNEKIQWLKLNDRDEKYTMLVDKYKVREYISKSIGEEYLIPLLGVWNSPKDINFELLPEKFVLKCNHDSGGVIICSSKSKKDSRYFANISKKMKAKLKRNYYYYGREWPYKNIEKKIIAEAYMMDSGDNELRDYKFFCFAGYVDSVMVCTERSTGNPKFYFFDKEWNFKKYDKNTANDKEYLNIKKPENFKKMCEIAAKLSQNIPFVRVDLYECNKKIYFGELTLYPDSGFDDDIFKEADIYFGSLLKLPEHK